MKKDSFAYRFFVLLIAFAIVAATVLLPLVAAKDVEPFVFWIVGGALLLIFIAITVVNEIIVRKKKK